jgi:cytochrome c-type biogenesis protein CcmH/NrfF
MKTIVALLALFFCTTLFAKEAESITADPALEARVMKLSEELRCLVCQNQTIADSNAGLAIDLRNQVREQLRQGRTDKDVIDYMVQRYGDFVLYRPPLKTSTWLLWAGPFLLLLGGGSLLLYSLNKRKTQIKDRPMSSDDHKRALALLGDNEGKEST